MTCLDEKTLHGMWNYFLMLEGDLDNSSRYIEPVGQENVYSFEFAKLLILACTEAEAVFKAICYEIEGKSVPGDIASYKATILARYPNVVKATVNISRLGRSIEPFAGWDSGKLTWWSAYNEVKHNRGSHFADANYINAANAISALYILIFYLAEITGIKFKNNASRYISSDYEDVSVTFGVLKKLPDFEDNK